MSLQQLTAKVGSSPVSCAIKTTDQYGRNVASCSLQGPAGEEDIGQWLVENGLAVSYR